MEHHAGAIRAFWAAGEHHAGDIRAFWEAGEHHAGDIRRVWAAVEHHCSGTISHQSSSDRYVIPVEQLRAWSFRSFRSIWAAVEYQELKCHLELFGAPGAIRAV